VARGDDEDDCHYFSDLRGAWGQVSMAAAGSAATVLGAGELDGGSLSGGSARRR
jgi:hypothetical protein